MRGTGKDLFAGTGAVKHQAFFAQSVYGSDIGIRAPTLPDDVTIPIQTEFFQGKKDVIRSARHHPGSIEVLHAQQPDPSGLPGQAVTAHGCNQGTKMQRTGGARRKTSHKRCFSHAEKSFPEITAHNASAGTKLSIQSTSMQVSRQDLVSRAAAITYINY